MIPYLVDVRPILDEVGGWIDLDAPYPLERFELGSEEFVLHAPAQVAVTISNAGAGIVTTGKVSAEVTATCARCLCEFPTTIIGEVEGFYLRPGSEPEGEETGAVDAEGAVDLGPALLAALIIEAPFVPLHDEECQGLCPECGTDLNTAPCDCHDHVDSAHPFAALESLLNPSDEDSSLAD